MNWATAGDQSLDSHAFTTAGSENKKLFLRIHICTGKPNDVLPAIMYLSSIPNFQNERWSRNGCIMITWNASEQWALVSTVVTRFTSSFGDLPSLPWLRQLDGDKGEELGKRPGKSHWQVFQFLFYFYHSYQFSSLLSHSLVSTTVAGPCLPLFISISWIIGFRRLPFLLQC